ncbi:MAG: amidohydrolase [Promethearchaeota archaeon]
METAKPTEPKKYAIHNGKILTCDAKHTIYDQGTIMISEGKIENILLKGEPIPEDYEIIPAEGMTIAPGFIDSHTHEGIFDGSVGPMGYDANEATNPSTPMVRVIDAINIEDPAFKEATQGGVTIINTGPGSANVIGGQFALLKTYAKTHIVDDYVIRAPSAMKAALGENPKRYYGADKKLPSTRMGIAAVFRKAFLDAQTYGKKWEEYKRKKADAETKKELDKIPSEPDRDLDKEVLLQVLRREIPIHIHCHQHNDIVTAVRLSEEFNLDLMIVHCTEGHKIAEFLADKNIPVSIGPSIIGYEKSELRDISFRTPALLYKAKVNFSIQSDTLPRLLYFQILPCMATKYGLPPEEALRAVTINAAKMVGVGDRVGSIEVGKDADLVIWSDHPVRNFFATVQLTMVDGEIAYKIKEKPEDQAES